MDIHMDIHNIQMDSWTRDQPVNKNYAATMKHQIGRDELENKTHMNNGYDLRQGDKNRTNAFCTVHPN